MLGNAALMPSSNIHFGMQELSFDQIDMVSGAWSWGDTAVAAGAISGVAWGIAEVAAIIPGGQGIAAGAGLVAGVAGAVAGVSAAVAYF